MRTMNNVASSWLSPVSPLLAPHGDGTDGDATTDGVDMPILKVPQDIASSPEDSSSLRFDTETQLFSNESGDAWTIDMLAGARPVQRIRRWVADNFPVRDLT